jgi:hypothetical protein
MPTVNMSGLHGDISQQAIASPAMYIASLSRPWELSKILLASSRRRHVASAGVMHNEMNELHPKEQEGV